MEEEKPHILVVDDDTRLRLLLGRFLRAEGFAVSLAQDAFEAKMFLAEYRFDLLVLDVMMPKMDGFTFLKELRGENNVPVLMLTAMGETSDRIAGFETGADDYLPKPFEPKELVLRIKSILRRAPQIKVAESVLSFGGCFYDMVKKELKSTSGDFIHLTNVEHQLMAILGTKAGQIFTREKLAEMLGAGNNPRSIDVQITRLRKKIEKDSKNPRYLQTIRGKGYMLLPK
ncbi:MAG: response regulator transcription factor [Alphaproteobacteria bacterium]|nr:response regulator transcription factor [Alphaproteobacteria bacterium]